MITGQPRSVRSPARDYRRAVVFALKFSKLPLPRQQPQRIIDPGLQTGVHLRVTAAWFKTHPARDRWGRHDSLSQILIFVKSVVIVSPSVLMAKYIAGR